MLRLAVELTDAHSQGVVVSKLDEDAGYRIFYAHGDGEEEASEEAVRAMLEPVQNRTYTDEAYTAWAGMRSAGLFRCFLRAIRAWKEYKPWDLIMAEDADYPERSMLRRMLRTYSCLDGSDTTVDAKLSEFIYGCMREEFPHYECLDAAPAN